MCTMPIGRGRRGDPASSWFEFCELAAPTGSESKSMNARFMSNFPSQRTKRSSLNECSQRKSVLRVTPAAMIRLSRSQSPFRESRSMNYEYKARSYDDAGTSSSGRRVKKTTTASRRADFNGVVALTATEFARVRECLGNPGSPTEANRRGSGVGSEAVRLESLRFPLRKRGTRQHRPPGAP